MTDMERKGWMRYELLASEYPEMLGVLKEEMAKAGRWKSEESQRALIEAMSPEQFMNWNCRILGIEHLSGTLEVVAKAIAANAIICGRGV